MNKKIAVIKLLSSKNNVIINLTNEIGLETIYSISGGQLTKKGREKTSNYVGITMISKVLEIFKEKEFNILDLHVRALGGIKSPRIYPVFNMILKFLKKNEVNIREILIKTPIPHNGTKRKYGRRGRRVW